MAVKWYILEFWHQLFVGEIQFWLNLKSKDQFCDNDTSLCLDWVSSVEICTSRKAVLLGLIFKSPATPLTAWIQTVWDWRLPKRYYLSMCLKGLQSCRLSNFSHFSKITYFFLYIILSYENNATYEHFWFFSSNLSGKSSHLHVKKM